MGSDVFDRVAFKQVECAKKTFDPAVKYMVVCDVDDIETDICQVINVFLGRNHNRRFFHSWRTVIQAGFQVSEEYVLIL